MSIPSVYGGGRVWIVEGRRLDTNAALYYYVWASKPDNAKFYLVCTALKGIPVEFTRVSELTHGRYEMTINYLRREQ